MGMGFAARIIVPKLVTELTPYEKFLRLPKIVKVKINGIELEYDKYLEEPLEKYYEKGIEQFKFELNENKKAKEEILNRYESSSIKENQDDLQKCKEYIQFLEG